MKKLFAVSFALVLLLTACGSSKSDAEVQQIVLGEEQASVAEESAVADDDVVEISENFFILQVEDVFANYNNYLGKTIRYEGYYIMYSYDEEEIHYVQRDAPGCCGDDGTVGFEVVYDGDYPETDDWVLAEGVLEQYDINGWNYLRLRLTTLEVQPVRGNDFVT